MMMIISKRLLFKGLGDEAADERGDELYSPGHTLIGVSFAAAVGVALLIAITLTS